MTRMNGQHAGDASYEDEVVSEQARILFGLILRMLCGRANITQDYLVEAGEAYRESLIAEGRFPPHYLASSLSQESISRVVTGARWPTRAQVRIWLDVLENTFNSEKYLEIRREHNLLAYTLPKDLKDDMYHLAGFGTQDEIVASYERRLPMTMEMITQHPRKRSPRSPKRQAFKSRTDELVN